MATGRVPGPLGFSDSAGLLVNTRRPLGVLGTTAVPLSSSAFESASQAPHALIRKKVVAVATPRKAVTKVVGASGTQSSGERSLEEFKVAVKEGQIQYLQVVKHRHRFDDVPDNELAIIEGSQRMRKAAAESCKDLLKAARAALDEGKSGGDAGAANTKRVGVHSAYRNYAEDGRAWNAAFNQWYDDKKAGHRRRALPGGPHGEAAIEFMVVLLRGKKAPPGWSNHSDGMAVDFSLVMDVEYTRDSHEENRAKWRATWFHAWLVSHARDYHFHPLDTEEWHWDYR